MIFCFFITEIFVTMIALLHIPNRLKSMFCRPLIDFFFKFALPSIILTHCEFPQTRSEWNLNNGQIGGGGTPAAGMMFAIPIAPIVVTNTSAAALMTNHGLMPTDLMENTGSKMSQANNVQHSNHFQHHQQQQHPHHTVGL